MKFILAPFSPSEKARFHFIDDLRGIAAVAVVLSHIVWLLPYPFTLFEYGRLGVEIFFVISGFVMAHSLRGLQINGRFIAKFFLRRSIRLDPVYWAAIVIELLALRLIWSQPFPGGRTLLINSIYLQDILGVEAIVGVAWTLCLELQFYLCLVILLGICQSIVEKFSVSQSIIYILIFGGLTLFSILTGSASYIHPIIDFFGNINGLFIPYWHIFFAGVLINWVYRQEVPHIFFWLYVFVATTVEIIFDLYPIFPANTLSILFAIGFSILVYFVSFLPLLKDGLNSQIISYFGRISYSLYLIHFTLGVYFIYVVAEYFGTGTLPMFLASGTAFLICVVGAHILYVTVEAPAVELSNRAKHWM